MNNQEKIEYVRDSLLEEAIESIKSHGRYWNPTISRTLTSTLEQLLHDEGFSVFVREIEPRWEHVFYLKEQHSLSDEIKAIAIKRFELMEKGLDKLELPV